MTIFPTETGLAKIHAELLLCRFTPQGPQDFGVSLRCELPKSGAAVFAQLKRLEAVDISKVEIVSTRRDWSTFTNMVFMASGDFTASEVTAVLRMIGSTSAALEQLE